MSMPNHIIRFYARSARPVWDFIDQEIPRSILVRRYGRAYSEPRQPGKPGGWYVTVVMETENAARLLREWISVRSDHSLEFKLWPDPDHSSGERYGVQIDLAKKSRPRFFYHRSFLTKLRRALLALRRWIDVTRQ
jgi:hypothetical protein